MSQGSPQGVSGVNGEREKEERMREKNEGLGARDKGTPATKIPIFSFLWLPAAAKF